MANIFTRLTFALLIISVALLQPGLCQTPIDSTAAKATIARVIDVETRLDLERNIALGNISTQEELDAALEGIDLLSDAPVADDEEGDAVSEVPVDPMEGMTTAERLNALRKRTRTLLEGYREAQVLRDEDLKDKLYKLVCNHKALGYGGARNQMYNSIDNYNGKVECVYTHKLFPAKNAESSKGGKGFMNCEHTWPQSFFNKQEPQRSDIWHLYPTDSDANGRRSSYPFGVVIGSPIWTEGGSKLGHNAQGKIVFEPRDDHKGNVARSLFYFSVRYKDPIDSMQEMVLRKWNQQDPPDELEKERANRIEKVQNNRNPFIDHPEYVGQIGDF